NRRCWRSVISVSLVADMARAGELRAAAADWCHNGLSGGVQRGVIKGIYIFSGMVRAMWGLSPVMNIPIGLMMDRFWQTTTSATK
ncbi:MAG: hypothetical protein ACRD0P_32210, partial [Stackebrandtia sp.]